LYKRILKVLVVWAHAPVERRWTGTRWDKVIIDGELDVGRECESLDEFTGKNATPSSLNKMILL